MYKKIRKGKATPRKIAPKPSVKKAKSPDTLVKERLWRFLPIVPHLLIIAACIGFYYAMVTFYLFFQWGIYLYYAIKLIVGYEILSASTRSYTLPIAALFVSLFFLLTHNLYFTTLMDTTTAWQLCTVAIVGICIAFYVWYYKKGDLC